VPRQAEAWPLLLRQPPLCCSGPPCLCSFWAVDDAHDPVAGACKVLALALEMQHAVLDVVMPDGQPVQARIGIHTGSCVSGLVGLSPPRWSVWGDTGACGGVLAPVSGMHGKAGKAQGLSSGLLAQEQRRVGRWAVCASAMLAGRSLAWDAQTPVHA